MAPTRTGAGYQINIYGIREEEMPAIHAALTAAGVQEYPYEGGAGGAIMVDSAQLGVAVAAINALGYGTDEDAEDGSA